MSLQIDQVSYNLQQLIAAARAILYQSFWLIDSLRNQILRNRMNYVTKIRLRNVSNSDFAPFGVVFCYGECKKILTIGSSFQAVGDAKLLTLMCASVVPLTFVDRCPWHSSDHFNTVVAEADLEETELLIASQKIKVFETPEETRCRRTLRLKRLKRGPKNEFVEPQVKMPLCCGAARSNKLLKLAKAFVFVARAPLLSLMLPCRQDGKCFVDVDWFTMHDVMRVLLLVVPTTDK